ncbi:hypothetical protein E2562_032218 [Oryza meyeriana var. granulata]|uniref:Uncharacterized protein n=1 Tax=Oryza meyeriana var. granulata TaxID=110450 RepID=A0A6G1D9V0_9ORYZ|nr:hypothetical protein E2562_032218 [Oryza meyeriana var. granulata]
MRSSSRVAVVAFPFSSHAPKLLAVARALATAAPSATFSFLSTAVSCHHRAVVPWSCRREEEVTTTMVIELFVEAPEGGGLKRALETAGEAAGGVTVSCVVGDAFMFMDADVGVPWVVVWTGGPCALLAHLIGDELREDIGDDHRARANELLTSYSGLGSYRSQLIKLPKSQ